MKDLQDLKKENERLSRELADACLEIVDSRIAYRKIRIRSKALKDALLLYLIQAGLTVEDAENKIETIVNDGLETSLHRDVEEREIN